MELSEQVITLEQAKKLKELGVSQNGRYHWWQRPSGEWIFITDAIASFYKRKETFVSFSAFTVAELGVMLPEDHYTYYSNNCWKWMVLSYKDQYGHDILDITEHTDSQFKTESEARADMLINAIEKSRIAVEEVNERLNR